MDGDKSQQLLGVATFFLILTSITFLLRLYTRVFVIKALGWDDYTMMLTLALYLGFVGCEIGSVKYGNGKKRALISDADAEIGLKYWWVCEVFYSPATAMLKVSVGLFLLRIVVKKLQRWIVYFFMAGSIVFGSFWLLITIFQCKPISFWWDLNPDHHGTCINATVFTICAYIVSVLNGTADFAFALLPMFMLKDSNMSSRTRYMVCCLLGVASIACIATIVRIPWLHTMNAYKGEFLYDTVPVAICSATEIGLGITAACAATLRPLFKRDEGSTAYGSRNPSRSAGGIGKEVSVHLRTVSAGSGNMLGGGSKKSDNVEVAYKGDTWTRLPDYARPESRSTSS